VATGEPATDDSRMVVGRVIAHKMDELRLRQARDEAHRARLEFLRADLFGGDCDTPARHVRDAEARARRIEDSLVVGRRRH
jgi:hypothetical protein